MEILSDWQVVPDATTSWADPSRCPSSDSDAPEEEWEQLGNGPSLHDACEGLLRGKNWTADELKEVGSWNPEEKDQLYSLFSALVEKLEALETVRNLYRNQDPDGPAFRLVRQTLETKCWHLEQEIKNVAREILSRPAPQRRSSVTIGFPTLRGQALRREVPLG